MKKLTTLTGWLVMAAALTIATTACSSEDNIADEPTPTTAETPKTYTMTVTASKGDDATTRALSEDGKKLNATWTEDDVIKVMKRRQQSSEVVYALLGTLSATTVSDDGLTATFTGSLDADKVTSAGGLAAGDLLLLGYPGTHLGSSTSAFVFNYNGQDGTLPTIASNYDYCMTTTSKSKMVTVASVDGGVVTTTGTASFTNQQAIVRFTLMDADGDPIYPPRLDITAVGLVQSVALPESGGISATPTEKTLTITPDGSTNVVYAAVRGFSNKDITLTATLGSNTYTYTKSSVSFDNGKYYSIGVKMIASKDKISLASLTNDYTAQSGDVLTGTLPSGIHLSIAAGAIVTLKNVTISDASQAGVTCLGDATIILSGTNSITTSAEGYPGIQAGGSGTTLTIQGTGSLTATATCGGAAGIGGGNQGAPYYNGINCGNIIIKSGTVTATGVSAGIGGGDQGTCGTITISGGTVTATGGSYSVGIGSGYHGTCGTITISGGTVTATGSEAAAGIGSGYDGTCGNITISGGTVEATGGYVAAGIGSGYEGTCGDITITSSVTSVTATKGEGSPNSIGKGSGTNASCGTVTIGGTSYGTDGVDYNQSDHFTFIYQP